MYTKHLSHFIRRYENIDEKNKSNTKKKIRNFRPSRRKIGANPAFHAPRRKLMQRTSLYTYTSAGGDPPGDCFRLRPRHRTEGAGNRRSSHPSGRTVRPDPRRRPNRRHPVRVRRAFVLLRRGVPETMNENVRDSVTRNAHRGESGPYDQPVKRFVREESQLERFNELEASRIFSVIRGKGGGGEGEGERRRRGPR